MDCRCLTREEYKSIIDNIVKDVDLIADLEENLQIDIDRARNSWDIKIVGVNHFLSIIIEQLLKRGSLPPNFIDYIYRLEDDMYFDIDEISSDFIDELYMNHMPISKNVNAEKLLVASKSNHEDGVSKYTDLLNNAFEEDLLIVLNKYHGKG